MRRTGYWLSALVIAVALCTLAWGELRFLDRAIQVETVARATVAQAANQIRADSDIATSLRSAARVYMAESELRMALTELEGSRTTFRLMALMLAVIGAAIPVIRERTVLRKEPPSC